MHAFSGLGFTPLSMLPGAAGSIQNDVLFLTAEGTVVLSVLGSWVNSRACDATAGVTVSGGFNLSDTLNIDGLANYTILEGFVRQDTLTIAGIADYTTAIGNGIHPTLSIDAIAALSLSFIYETDKSLTLAATADIALVITRLLIGTLTVTAIGTFSSPGGLVLNNFQAIEGFSALSALDGLGYTETLSVDAIADIDLAEVYLMQEIVSVAGVADLTLAHTYVAGATLTVGAIGQVTNTSIATYDSAALFGSVSDIRFENLFDFFLDMVVIAAMTVTPLRTTTGTENPAAAGSFGAECQAVYNRTITQTLVMTQSATLATPTQHGTQTFVMFQSATCVKVHNEEITQTLVMTQEANAFRALSHTLVIAQTVAVTKVHNRTVTQTLTINQSADRNMVINRTVEQTLVFYPDLIKKVPIIGSINGGGVTQFEYNASPATAYLVPAECLVILSVATQVVVLPCPQFGDSQAYMGSIDLKRTMTGDTFTYVRKSRLEKLQYSFHVGSRKAYEMKQFLLNHSHELMTMMNWKGETWLVMITNNPVEFVNTGRWQNKGERVEFTLEFEGVKR